MSYEVSNLYPPVFQIKYVPRRPSRMTLIAFKMLRALARSWYRNGKLHREDAPAIIQILDKKTRETFEVWYNRGVRHRDGGAAYISPKFQRWYQNGELHREDGPAIAGPRYDHWYTDGILIRTLEH